MTEEEFQPAGTPSNSVDAQALYVVNLLDQAGCHELPIHACLGFKEG
jgi:hypothetical protein